MPTGDIYFPTPKIKEPTSITNKQKFKLLFKRKKERREILYKNEHMEISCHTVFKILNGEEIILDVYYANSVSIPNIEIIYDEKEIN